MLLNMQMCKSRRKELGLTLEQVAGATGTNRYQLSTYEKVNAAPIEVFERVRDYLENFTMGTRNDEGEIIASEPALVKFVPMEYSITLGVLRRQLNIPQNDVINAVLINQSRLSSVERGKIRMTALEYQTVSYYLVSMLMKRVLGPDYITQYMEQLLKDK